MMLNYYYSLHSKIKNFYQRNKILHVIISLASILFWVFAFKSSILDANNIPSGSMIPTLKIGDFLFVNQMRYTLRIPFTNIRLLEIDKPKRGDIVTFTPPQQYETLRGKTLVKRVIGVPGDMVNVVDNEIYINNIKYPTNLKVKRDILNDLDYPPIDSGQNINDYELYEEDIIYPTSKKSLLKYHILKQRYDPILDFSDMRNPQKSWKLSAGEYMVMGDNRDNSDDSRRWGLLNEKNIYGKVFIAYFSINWGIRFESSFDNTSESIFSKNPILNLFEWIAGKYSSAYIRWDRIGLRIY